MCFVVSWAYTILIYTPNAEYRCKRFCSSNRTFEQANVSTDIPEGAMRLAYMDSSLVGENLNYWTEVNQKSTPRAPYVYQFQCIHAKKSPTIGSGDVTTGSGDVLKYPRIG